MRLGIRTLSRSGLLVVVGLVSLMSLLTAKRRMASRLYLHGGRFVTLEARRDAGAGHRTYGYCLCLDAQKRAAAFKWRRGVTMPAPLGEPTAR
jgi:hypothetical protein